MSQPGEEAVGEAERGKQGAIGYFSPQDNRPHRSNFRVSFGSHFEDAVFRNGKGIPAGSRGSSLHSCQGDTSVFVKLPWKLLHGCCDHKKRKDYKKMF